MAHVLGLDVGGTKTVCRLADARGDVLVEARGDGANLQADGELAVEKTLHGVMDEAVGGRKVLPTAICLGMAGVDREDDLRVIRGIMARIGYMARVLVVNDALIALEAGVGDAPGLVVVAGTGSIVYGRNARGEAARAGGWGYVLGDEGSGYWMGRLALRAVVREADRRGRATVLTPRVLAHFGVTRPQDLVHRIYGGGLCPPAIAALAAVVHAAWAEGDPVARDIVDRGAHALVSAAQSVAGRLSLGTEPFTVVLSGGIFFGVPSMAEAVAAGVEAALPRARARRLEVEPVAGAVRLALAEAAGGARLPRYITI